MSTVLFFENFCAAVCERVRFKPDRGKIRAELMDHLTDHLEVLVAQGMDRDEARAEVVAAMGDPAAIGDALDRLHSPGMGWLLVWLRRASRVVLAAALLAAVLHPARLCVHLAALPPGYEGPANPDLEVAAAFRPTTTFRSQDYVFTVERAYVARSQSSGELFLHYYLKVSHKNPWLRGPDLQLWITAEDDLGNRYPSFNEALREQLSSRLGSSTGNSAGEYPFVTYYDLWVSPIPADASEVTVFFDHYGERAFSLLIPLRGGGEA